VAKKIDQTTAISLMKNNGLIPLEPYKGAMSRWKCKCKKCGQTVFPTYSNVRSGHSGCAYCSGNLLSPKKIASLLRKNRLSPLVPYPGTQKPWKCQCLSCGKTVNPHFGSLIAGQGGCIYCAGKKVDSKDAEATFKEKGFAPLMPYPGANKPWLARCMKCRFEISPTFSDVKRGVGCKICGRKEIPEVLALKRWKENHLKPLVKFPGANKPWKSQCLKCQRTVNPWYRQPTCKYCAGRAVVPTEAIKLMKKSKLLPLEQYPGAMLPWRCKCTVCGKVVSPTYTSIRYGQGCKYCANLGFQYGKAAIIYLITNARLKSHKLGITGKSAIHSRLKEHENGGWIVLKTMGFTLGEDAYQVEQETLRWLREDLGLPPYLSKRSMPQHGFTETVSADEIDALEIWRYVEKISHKNARRGQAR